MAAVTLGDLIATLERMPLDAEVVFSHGTMPTKLMSWRGRYDELTLDGRMANEGPPVAALLDDCRAAVGGTFQGYKGGDYTMSEDTPVWADEYGDCTYRVVLGVVLSGPKVVIQTHVISEYA